MSAATCTLAYVLFLVAAALLAHWMGRRAGERLAAKLGARLAEAARAAPVAPVLPVPVAPVSAPVAPAPPCITFRFVWWNGCRMEIDPGIHAANAVAHCCWARTKERA